MGVAVAPEGFDILATQGQYSMRNHLLTEESEIKLKDFRLRIATRKAVDEIKTIKPPRTERELKAKMKKVAMVVAATICTSPNVALSAYIDPHVWAQWKSVSRQSEKSPALIAAKAKKIDDLLAEVFRSRWKALELDCANGIDVAKAHAHRFFGSDSRARLRTAKRYYDPARITKFAGSSTSEIVELCWAWFNPFQVFAHDNGNDLSEIGDQLEVLVGSEYVAMTWGLFDGRPSYIEYFDPDDEASIDHWACPHDVYPLPDLTTVYGDVYEAIVYSYEGERLRVCKSITEPFSGAERIDAMDGIEQEFLDNASEEGDSPKSWKINFRTLTTELLPKYGRSLIEAHILGDVGSAEQKKKLRLLKQELSQRGDGYLKRARTHVRR